MYVYVYHGKVYEWAAGVKGSVPSPPPSPLPPSPLRTYVHLVLFLMVVVVVVVVLISHHYLFAIIKLVTKKHKEATNGQENKPNKNSAGVVSLFVSSLAPL